MEKKSALRYIQLAENGILQKRVKQAKRHMKECYLCPHECGINRRKEIGFCRSNDQVIVASYGPHFGEEPSLVGKRGSGTIFFAYCNMRCVYCQNCELSFGGEGEVLTNEELAEIMLKLQEDYQCHNINFVTPTHFVPNILEALLIAAEDGLNIPLVYNCGGYERIETLTLLDGIIDIYMPDFKYDLPEWGERFSQIKDYPAKVKAALKEMDRQVGGLEVSEEGLAYRGLIIRHLLLPGAIEQTKRILDFIKKELSPGCLVNIMDQYYPAHHAFDFQELTKPISLKEYKEAVAYAKKIGLKFI